LISRFLSYINVCDCPLPESSGRETPSIGQVDDDDDDDDDDGEN